ncbi:hypothetical protein ACFX5Q_34525 [Mesorhizobium sp. IMUNJ 23033]|uniref:hypothetical protein n=1 Tax=Mesorhizobium sp. IMUNJ 23033 TaxID=3378039 RepID=UPI00384EBDC2
MVPGVHQLAVLDVEDDATEHVQPFAVALPGILMDAHHESVLALRHVQKFGLEGPLADEMMKAAEREGIAADEINEEVDSVFEVIFEAMQHREGSLTEARSCRF